ncbi:MAG TPA: enoyl-CoA hydratase-related protein [Acidimicrobiia bacterium]|nr:enoyl-CoA hydratase-related protein [Acidimicrobiia bacterium]
MTGGPEVVTERRGAVLVVRLNRPEARNALTWGMIRDVGAAVAAADSDPETRAVVVTGTGDRAFCAGMDLRAYAESDDFSVAESEQIAVEYMRLLEGEVGVPVVGAVNASALAGGFELMLGCDVVVASADAKFGLPEVKRGLFAGAGVMHVGRRMPLGIALELALTGDSIDAARAYELGLVNAVVPPVDVLPTALALAQRIAANGPLAIRATKELVRLASAGSPRAPERLHALRTLVFESEDAKEGATAFIEKREPRWQGR